MTSAMDDAVGPGCSARDVAGTDAETGAGARGDADGPEVAEGKVDITTLDKTPIMVCY